MDPVSALKALVALLVVTFVALFATPAKAIGTVTGVATPQTQYKLCYTYGQPRYNGLVECAQTPSKQATCEQYAGKVAADQIVTDNNQYGYTYEAVPTVLNANASGGSGCSYSVLVSKTQKPANMCTNFCTTTSTVSGTPGYTNVVVYSTECPANAAANGANCECSVGFRPPFSGAQDSCNPYSCEAKPRGNDRVLEGLTAKPTVCDGSPGCAQNYCDTAHNAYQTNTTSDYGCNIKESLYAATQGADGKWTARYVSAYSGTACMPTGAADPNSPVQPAGTPASAPGIDGSASMPSGTCAAGTCPGTVNGNPVCVACSRTVGETTTTSVDTNASGVTTGTTTTNKKADCIGDVCTTTTTTTTNGSVSNVTTTTESKDSMCKSSPNHPACGGGGGGGNGDGEEDGGTWFNGNCDSGFACSPNTDAATCAIATEQHRRACQFVKTFGDGSVTEWTTKGEAMVVAGDTPTGHPRNAEEIESHDLSAGFDQGRLFAGACPQDRTVGSGQFAVSLPLSKICGPLDWIGNVLVAATALACLGIVFVRGQ